MKRRHKKPEAWKRALLYIIKLTRSYVCPFWRKKLRDAKTPADFYIMAASTYPRDVENVVRLVRVSRLGIAVTRDNAQNVLADYINQPSWIVTIASVLQPAVLTEAARAMGWKG